MGIIILGEGETISIKNEFNLSDYKFDYDIIVNDVDEKNFHKLKEIIEKCNKNKISLKIVLPYNEQIFQFIKERIDCDFQAIIISEFDYKNADYKMLQELSNTKTYGIPIGTKLPNHTKMWCNNPQAFDFFANNLSFTNSEYAYIRNIIKTHFNDFKNMTGLEKIVAVETFIQQNIQYIDATGISSVCTKKYYNEKIPGYNTDQYPILSLTKHAGVCNAIAELTMLLLNNPFANIECYMCSSREHAWNYINFNGKFYVNDTTRNITRGKNRFATSLQASGLNLGSTLTTPERMIEQGLGIESQSALSEPEKIIYSFRPIELQNLAKIEIPREQLIYAARSLKRKGFNFQFNKEPYYKQTLTAPIIE